VPADPARFQFRPIPARRSPRRPKCGRASSARIPVAGSGAHGYKGDRCELSEKESMASVLNSGAAILNRLIGPEKPDLSREAALSFLKLDFCRTDHVRMSQ
jgi:hypothetical protein